MHQPFTCPEGGGSPYAYGQGGEFGNQTQVEILGITKQNDTLPYPFSRRHFSESNFDHTLLSGANGSGGGPSDTSFLSKNGIIPPAKENHNYGPYGASSSLNTTMQMSTLLQQHPQALQTRGLFNGTINLRNMTTQRGGIGAGDVFNSTLQRETTDNMKILSGETMLSGPDADNES